MQTVVGERVRAVWGALRCVMVAAALSVPMLSAPQTGASVCTGKFPNLLTGICWDCIFPMTLGGGALDFGSGDDYETGASKSPVCACAKNLQVGTPMSFWEPRFMVDTPGKPGCFPLLGGVDIKPPYNENAHAATRVTNAQIKGTARAAFGHVNEYINPVMTVLGLINQSPCLDSRSFDVPFLSWADPTWNDDDLTNILTPYAFAFAGIASVAAEAPDAIAAARGFPIAELFWTAGAWGPMYPLTGNVSVANTPEQVSHLLLARLFAKLHAAGTQQSVAGDDALKSCGALGFAQLLMDKRQYKTNRIISGGDEANDGLCTPIGRPLMFQEAGFARPQDKDYGYFVFQRKDCCAPFIGP